MTKQIIERATVQGTVELYRDQLETTYASSKDEVEECLIAAKEELSGHQHHLFNERVLKRLLYVTLLQGEKLKDTLKDYITIVQDKERTAQRKADSDREFFLERAKQEMLLEREKALIAEFSPEERKAIRVKLGL